uniref:Uncharacterized protein n=1 Tax=Anguilla anguilla TaxID=7936 RepID=A0A0E9PP93_ANGAN
MDFGKWSIQAPKAFIGIVIATLLKVHQQSFNVDFIKLIIFT